VGDNIVERLGCALVSHGSAEQSCGECAYCLAAAEIERLRAEAWALAQDLAFMTAEVDKFAGENYEQYCEIERLRAAGDALAKSLAEFNDPEDELRLLAWQEARRG